MDIELPKRSPWDALRDIPQPELADCLESYFSCQAKLTALEHHPAEILVPDAVLRERDPLLLEAHGKPVVDLLRPAYLAMGT